jgi:Tfp pilus assembly protein PilW
MRTQPSDAGFSLMELLAATAIGLVVIGTAMTTFKDTLGMTNTTSDLADTSQNLRGGTNFLIHDLVLAGRGIPTGGIPIPSGPGARPILRPSPPAASYNFDNVGATTLTAITSGSGLGPTIAGQSTDIVTTLTIDPILDSCLGAPLSAKPAGTAGNVPVMAADGSSLNVGNDVACVDPSGGTWIAGNATQAPVKKGDLLVFTDPNGRNTIQTVTSSDATTLYFAQNADDTFGFNQPGAAAGSITPLLGEALSVQRVVMYTYYVDPNGGTPRLMRRYNMATPQALAGVVEDLQLSYDLVDGLANPTNVPDLPYTSPAGTTYSANQIRKVSVHIGVRSENMSTRTHDFLRNQLSTVVSIRNLAYVDRYQ